MFVVGLEIFAVGVEWILILGLAFIPNEGAGVAVKITFF